MRYIWKEVDPPDTNETRGVFDLKWFKILGNEWLLTDRNRIDVRHFENNGQWSYRYRNRIMLEKPFPVFSKFWTGFASYEIYWDSRFSGIARQRIIAGVSVPLASWSAIDVFYAYHYESKPKPEHGNAIGIAFSLMFYD